MNSDLTVFTTTTVKVHTHQSVKDRISSA